MLIIGLTGGIACGKSTVSEHLKNAHQLTIVDADKIAREVVEPGTSGYKQIVAYFDKYVPRLLNDDGTLDRRSLASFVFQHKEHLSKLNSIVHPAVRLSMMKKVLCSYVTGKRVVVLDVPLLFESGLDKFCGTTILVSCEKETQLKRLLARDPDISAEDAENRIKNQMSNQLKAEKADVILMNDSSLEELKEQIDLAVDEVTPSYFRNLLLLIPPIGIMVAGWIFCLKRLKEYYKNVKID